MSILFRTYPLLSDAETFPWHLADFLISDFSSLCWDDRIQKQRISYDFLHAHLDDKILEGIDVSVEIPKRSGFIVPRPETENLSHKLLLAMGAIAVWM